MDWRSDKTLVCLHELVLPAGGMLLDHLGRAGAVDRKEGTELVTELDRRAEDLLVAGLSRHFPEDTVVAEESGRTGPSDDRIWYLDPLDGTTNFAHGHPFFCISVALAVGGVLEAAAVYAPRLDEFFLARRERGAWLLRPGRATSVVLPLRRPVRLDQALLATGFPYVRDEVVDRNVELVRSFLKYPCHGIRRDGSAALDLAHVAAGVLDGFWELKLRPWDTAAGVLIAREAGAVVTDFTGAEVPLPFADVLCAAPGLHRQMLEVIDRQARPGG